MRYLVFVGVAMLMTSPGAAEDKAAGFNITATVCKTLGGAPGKGNDLVFSPGSTFFGSCHKGTDEVLCAVQGSKKGDVDAHTKTPLRTVKFVQATKESPYLLLISDDGLNHLLINTRAQRFSWAQTFVGLSDGVTMQKHCLGTTEIL